MSTPSATAAPAVAGEECTGEGKKPIPMVTPSPSELGNLSSTAVPTSTIDPSSIPPTPSSRAKSSPLVSKSITPTKSGEKSSNTCGFHDEIGPGNKNGKTSTIKNKPAPKSSPPTPPPSKKKYPLLSRYCGCCGDLISTKAYGYDRERDCDRRFVYNPEEKIRYSPSKLQEGAEAVKQNLTSKTPANKSRTSTRKKKKLSKTAMMMGEHQEFLKALDPWPEEAVRMDATIIEGLLSLRTTPVHEMNCRCWREPPVVKRDVPMSATTPFSTISPATKKKMTTKLTATKAGKTTAKKKIGTKTTANGSPEKEIVSTKVVITKCPKTGKKIRKTVRVVKKLVKKKVKKLVGPDGLPLSVVVNTGKSGLPSANIPGDVSLFKPKMKPNFAAMDKGTPDTSATTKSVGSSGKKRSRDKAIGSKNSNNHNNNEDDPDDSHSDDDGSDDDGDTSYNGPGISLKKRRRNDEKADLELRDRLMNCTLEGGPIAPSHQELMELTTIRKRNALQTFYKRFNELRQFIAIFGDANVPQQFPENHSLGIWVNKMRMERKKWDTGSERTSLTERKIELLESIDFIWAQNHKGEIGWERRFQEIRKFKRKHGHCNVPTKSAENRALGRWVSTQRTMYKNYTKGFVGKSLTREEQERRIFLLLKEGFLFSMIPSGQNPGGGGSGEGEDYVVDIAAATAAAEGEETALLRKLEKAGVGRSGPFVADGEENPFLENLSKAPSSDETTEVPAKKEKLHDSIPQPKTAPSSPKPDTTDSHQSGSMTISNANNDDSDAAKNTNTQEPKKSNPVSKGKETDCEEKKDDAGDQSDDKPTAPSSQPQQMTESPVVETEDTIAPPSSTEARPVSAAASAAAQVSLSTTPSTTPSVSRTGSPLRSPDKNTVEEKEDDAKTDGEEENSAMEVETDADTVETKKVEPKSGGIKETIVEFTAVSNDAESSKPASLDSEKVSTPRPHDEEEVPQEQVTGAAEPSTPTKTAAETKMDTQEADQQPASKPSESEKPLVETVKPEAERKMEEAEKGTPKRSTKPNNAKVAERRGTTTPVPMSPPIFIQSVSSPAVLRVKETEFTTTVSIRLKDRPSRPMTPTESGASHFDYDTCEEQLVTSNGMKISIKLDDPDNEVFDSSKRDSGSFDSMTISSPGRRSGRARKKSARQLEAEKSPIRESILGR